MNPFPFIFGVTLFLAGAILFTRWFQRTELLRQVGELEKSFRHESYDCDVEEGTFLEAYQKHVRQFPEDLVSKKFEPARSMFDRIAYCHRRACLD